MTDIIDVQRRCFCFKYDKVLLSNPQKLIEMKELEKRLTSNS